MQIHNNSLYLSFYSTIFNIAWLSDPNYHNISYLQSCTLFVSEYVDDIHDDIIATEDCDKEEYVDDESDNKDDEKSSDKDAGRIVNSLRRGQQTFIQLCTFQFVLVLNNISNYNVVSHIIFVSFHAI